MLATNKNDSGRIQGSEMKLIRRVRCCTKWGRIPNEQITADLGVYNINDRTSEYKSQWKLSTSIEWIHTNYNELLAPK